MSGRKEHWEAIYSEKKPNEVSWYQQDPQKSLELIREVSTSKENQLIDVGGGASVLAGMLLEDGYRSISVLDISEKALQYAKARLGPKADQITWIVADITEFQPRGKYDLWHDRAVFHFLTEKADRKRYVSGVKAGLKKGGYVILGTFAKDGPDKCSNLPVRQYDRGLVQEAFGTGFELVKELAEIHRTPWGKEQKFAYFLLRRTEDQE